MFAGENTGWKCYLNGLLKPYGGLFLLHCDYDPKDYNISNQFYAELIQFWAEFRNAFSDKDNKSSVIWNNKNIRIDGKPVFYKKFFEKKIIVNPSARLIKEQFRFTGSCQTRNKH